MPFLLKQCTGKVTFHLDPKEKRCLRASQKNWKNYNTKKTKHSLRCNLWIEHKKSLITILKFMQSLNKCWRPGSLPLSWFSIKDGHSVGRILIKLNLKNFNENPLECPEQSSMFIATVDSQPMPNSENMSHPKTLFTGRAKTAILGLRYSGKVYGAAWSLLERKFGRLHLFIDAQLESLRIASQGFSAHKIGRWEKDRRSANLDKRSSWRSSWRYATSVRLQLWKKQNKRKPITFLSNMRLNACGINGFTKKFHLEKPNGW